VANPIEISVKPNPVVQGGSVTVTGDPGAEIMVGFEGELTPVQLDQEGKATIKAPGEGGEFFTVSDGKWPKPGSVRVRITSSFK
jgi:hypothetical protein